MVYGTVAPRAGRRFSRAQKSFEGRQSARSLSLVSGFFSPLIHVFVVISALQEAGDRHFSLRGLPPLRPRPEAPAARRGLGTGEAREK